MKSKGVQEKKLIAKQCESNTVESENITIITIITTKFTPCLEPPPPFLGNPLFPTKIKKFTPHSLTAIQIAGC